MVETNSLSPSKLSPLPPNVAPKQLPQAAASPDAADAARDAIKLETSWKERLAGEFAKPYMQELKAFLRAEYAKGKTIFPRGTEYFQALNLTPLHATRVVILGQDPYHGPGQAHGLCFSVKPGVALPPSLENIFHELHTDLGLPKPSHGCLESWAQQGVLLLNSVLTVEKGRAGSHAGRGWEQFTDAVMALVSAKETPVAFVLWGAYAQHKGVVVDPSKHLVLRAPHPSPFAADRGFFGSRPFSKINAFLAKTGQAPIDWRTGVSF